MKLCYQFYNNIKLESGLYTVRIKGVLPKYGSNLMNLNLEIIASPVTKMNRDTTGKTVFITVDTANESFQEVFKVFSWKKRTAKLEYMAGIYMDCWVEPRIENGETITTFSNFEYSYDLNKSEYDRADDEM